MNRGFLDLNEHADFVTNPVRGLDEIALLVLAREVTTLPLCMFKEPLADGEGSLSFVLVHRNAHADDVSDGGVVETSTLIVAKNDGFGGGFCNLGGGVGRGHCAIPFRRDAE